MELRREDKGFGGGKDGLGDAFIADAAGFGEEGFPSAQGTV